MKIKRTRIEITKSNLLNKRPFHHVDLPRKTPVILAGNSRLVPQMGQLSHRLTFSLQHNFFGYQVFVVFQSTTAEIMTDKIAPNMVAPRANGHHFVFSNFVLDFYMSQKCSDRHVHVKLSYFTFDGLLWITKLEYQTFQPFH